MAYGYWKQIAFPPPTTYVVVNSPFAGMTERQLGQHITDLLMRKTNPGV